jgi:hypothetical protein
MQSTRRCIQDVLLPIFRNGVLAHLPLPDWEAFITAVYCRDRDGIVRAVRQRYAFPWHTSKIRAGARLLPESRYSGRARQLVSAMGRMRLRAELRHILTFYVNSGLLDMAELHAIPLLPSVIRINGQLYSFRGAELLEVAESVLYYAQGLENLHCAPSGPWEVAG